MNNKEDAIQKTPPLDLTQPISKLPIFEDEEVSLVIFKNNIMMGISVWEN